MEEEVHFNEITDGDLFKLTKFKRDNSPEIGKIAQRYKDSMIFINESYGSSYSSIFEIDNSDEDWKAIIIRRAIR